MPLGPVQGLPIQLHASFFLLFPLGLLVSGGDIVAAIVFSAFTFVLVLLHELGHLYAARIAGSYLDRIVLWPLGGLVQAETPLRPMVQSFVAAAGPAVNLFIAALFLPWVIGRNAPPLWPLPIHEPLELLFGLNQIILLVNLVPAFPTDGGRIWQGLLWRFLGFRRATIATLAASTGLGLSFVVYGATAGQAAAFLAGVALLGSALYYRRSLRIAEVVDGVWVETPGFLSPGFGQRGVACRVRHWWGKRRQERRHLRRAREAQVLDDLLNKITRVGLAGLTIRERRFLLRQSDRIKREHGMTLK